MRRRKRWFSPQDTEVVTPARGRLQSGPHGPAELKLIAGRSSLPRANCVSRKTSKPTVSENSSYVHKCRGEKEEEEEEEEEKDITDGECERLLFQKIISRQQFSSLGTCQIWTSKEADFL